MVKICGETDMKDMNYMLSFASTSTLVHLWLWMSVQLLATHTVTSTVTLYQEITLWYP